MKLHRILAIYKKSIKEAFTNKMIFLQFFLYPIMALVFKSLTKNEEGVDAEYFVILFATMFVGMMPTSITANLITEEKEKDTLKVLVMNNVRPSEFLLGITAFIMTISAIGALAFAFIAGYSAAKFAIFLAVMMLSTLISVFLGAAVGIFTKNQASASSLIIPVSLFLSFLPMAAMFNTQIGYVSKLLYTQNVYYLIEELTLSAFSWQRILTLAANMAVFVGLFVYAYKKRSLIE